MSPGGLLSLMICITAAALIADRADRRRRRVMFQRLAREWGMHFQPRDVLRLAAKVSRDFPIPGAANIKIRDVIYGNEGDLYRFVFTAEYSVGVVRTKHRRLRAATYAEPRSREAVTHPHQVILATEGVKLIDQYRQLAPKEKQQN
jgi:hypothetical protein